MNNYSQMAQPLGLPESTNVELLTVMSTSKGFVADARFILPKADKEPQILVRFRQGCNDFPSAGQVWEVLLCGIDAKGFITDAMMRISD